MMARLQRVRDVEERRVPEAHGRGLKKKQYDPKSNCSVILMMISIIYCYKIEI